ncbi:hypothetical protein Y1Q_0019335 [Alligator mississippiensis]|uniref:Uncharacterized protein n=1 Tax=Alligator mississippiensis TaxID=8496 RepID=A0A151MQU6_ALLMI|nr:hypothetical protein Y1Q_0019335 [Alligator mississippiensis]
MPFWVCIFKFERRELMQPYVTSVFTASPAPPVERMHQTNGFGGIAHTGMKFLKSERAVLTHPRRASDLGDRTFTYNMDN